MTTHAFNILYRDHYAPLCYYAQSFVHNIPEAQDIVTEAYAAAWAMDECGHGYLYVSIRNKCYNALKHRKYVSAYVPDETALIDTELVRLIYAKAKGLPERCREIFFLHYFDGIRVKDIAAQLGVSASNVSSQLGNAIRVLKGVVRIS